MIELICDTLCPLLVVTCEGARSLCVGNTPGAAAIAQCAGALEVDGNSHVL